MATEVTALDWILKQLDLECVHKVVILIENRVDSSDIAIKNLRDGHLQNVVTINVQVKKHLNDRKIPIDSGNNHLFLLWEWESSIDGSTWYKIVPKVVIGKKYYEIHKELEGQLGLDKSLIIENFGDDGSHDVVIRGNPITVEESKY